MVYQVPMPEPLRKVEPREGETRRMHGEKDYGKMYVRIYEDILQHGEITMGADYPVTVFARHIMAPSPIPRWDTPKLNNSANLHLFGAGREKKIYAVPPYTEVEPLSFNDYPFRVESFEGKICAKCGSSSTFMNELPSPDGNAMYICSDASFCLKNQEKNKGGDDGDA